ncbi:MAG TPA: MlaE family lipid ABC transporter permease subunit [Deltaproteobacteria bacterium]|nr:MlaE family lipid ABC transporter permease subunit [Deltaproteobacteria bacterium]
MNNEEGSQVKLVPSDKNRVTFFISGSVTIENSVQVRKEILAKVTSDISVNVVEFDLGGVTVMDSAGIAVLVDVQKYLKEHGFEFHIVSLPSKVSGFLKLVDTHSLLVSKEALRPKKKRNVIEYIGEVTLEGLEECRSVVTFLGEIVVALASLIRHPKRMRWDDFFLFVERAGTDALPIVSLLSLLMGLIMAFQAAVQLRQFGANIFVADLVGISILRELGPLLTAIIIAGRSGASFAAEIGTMKVSEEIDALSTMGFKAVSFLALPRILAATFVGPFLTLVGDFVGVFGGLIVGMISLDLSPTAYLEETYTAITFFDLFSGLIKSVAFAVLIAGVGCLRGFQVERSADSVGKKTTSAVVSGIFLIVFADAIFTIIFHYF